MREAGESPAPPPRPHEPRPRVYWRAPGGGMETGLDDAAIARALASGQGMLWVDVDAASPEQQELLRTLFRFHPLAIEDTQNPNSRVKCEEYQGYLFVIARAVRFDDTTDDPYDLDTANLCFFLGPNYLVTTHLENVDSVEHMRTRCVEMPDILLRGPARLMHGILDVTVDAFFPILDQVDEFVDALEQRVFVNYDDAAARDIFAVKRLVLSVKRHLSPMRDVLSLLTNRPSDLLSPNTQLYYRDVYDHVLRLNDGLDTYRELLSSTMDSYLTQASNALSQSTKRLSVVATISLPFVIVSGMWGMNFDRIPLAHHPYGFVLLLVLQLLLGVVFLVILRWRRLI
jgi:magnesium transporter